MKAKQTIMSQKEFDKYDKMGKWENDCTPLLEHQAEISFRAGIREVVKWLNIEICGNSYGYIFDDKLVVSGEILHKKLQSQLKKWGINEDNK